MPPAQRSGRGTNRAASVPVSRRGNARLESLRSKEQSLSSLDVEPSILQTRGRKHNSVCATSQQVCTDITSAAKTVSVADPSPQPPQKRQKRSTSTPPVPAQLQSRRRSRSRVGSPTTDVEVPPSRFSARLARKLHSLINGRSSDIYMHLAGPDGAETLLREPSAGSVILPTSNTTVGTQSVQKPRGRRRKYVYLADENAKKDLMEEWAQIRQSQVTLPLSGNACITQVHPHDARNSDRSISSIRLEPRHASEYELMEGQRTLLDVSPKSPFPAQMDSSDGLPTSTNETKLDPIGSERPSGNGTELSIIPSVETLLGEGSANHELVGVPGTTHALDLMQYPGSSSTPSVLSMRNDPIATTWPINEHAEAMSPDKPSKDMHSTMPSFDDSNIHLDSNGEFYMLDILEVFTLPWEPVASRLYIPPSLAKLISGMKEQLTIEARARRRAEEQYQAELSRRISAEKIIQDLQTELEERQN